MSESSEILLAGTGTAFHTDGRGSQAVVIRPSEGAPFLVDAGPTVACQLERLGFDTGGLDRLFVTHLHGDHIAGWPFLLLNMAVGCRRSRDFEVVGPSGVRESLEELCRICYGELLASSSLEFELRYRELPPGVESNGAAGDLPFEVLPMDHHPTSLGFRFELPEGRVAVSGDTRWCAELERLCRGTEAALVECTGVEESEFAHVSLAELRRLSGRLGARRIVLVHLTDAVATALAQDPIERIVAGHDGMSLELTS